MNNYCSFSETSYTTALVSLFTTVYFKVFAILIFYTYQCFQTSVVFIVQYLVIGNLIILTVWLALS